MKKNINIGVVGAGVVGTQFLEQIFKRQFKFNELRVFGGPRTAGKSLHIADPSATGRQASGPHMDGQNLKTIQNRVPPTNNLHTPTQTKASTQKSVTQSDKPDTRFKTRTFTAQALKPGCFKGLDVVFFAVDDPVAKQWAPQAVEQGVMVIDNSAHYRMNEKHVLCVPEINASDLPRPTEPTIIANPNCSTIQLVMLLHPLHQAFGLDEVRVCTYQALSGAGREAYVQLQQQSQHYLDRHYKPPLVAGAQTEAAAQTAIEHQTKPQSEVVASSQAPSPQTHLAGAQVPTQSTQDQSLAAQVLTHSAQVQDSENPLAFNCTPRIGRINAQGFCSEEEKIRRETKKILSLPELKISAFTVRVPVFNAHAEVLWLRLKSKTTRAQIQQVLQAMPGLQLADNLNKELQLRTTSTNTDQLTDNLAKACQLSAKNNDSLKSNQKKAQDNYDFVTQREVSGHDNVFVSHIRQEPDFENTWSFWIVADNLLKGAALNGLQIAEHLYATQTADDGLD